MPDGLFDRFWNMYPRHVAKHDAQRAFKQTTPTAALVDTMIAALQWQTQQPSWLKEGGAYVPYPATWLRGRRWEDEPPEIPLSRLTPYQQAKRLGLK